MIGLICLTPKLPHEVNNMKHAIVILSDPNSGTEEAVARAYNGCAFAFDCKQHGDEVAIIFLGAGARWPKALEDLNHPAHKVYSSVKENILGVSSECAVVFGAEADTKELGYKLLTDNALPETSGLASIRNLIDDGYSVVMF